MSALDVAAVSYSTHGWAMWEGGPNIEPLNIRIPK